MNTKIQQLRSLQKQGQMNIITSNGGVYSIKSILVRISQDMLASIKTQRAIDDAYEALNNEMRA